MSGKIVVTVDHGKGEVHFSEMTTRHGVPTPRLYSVVRREAPTVKPPVRPEAEPPEGTT
jgi:hypothetical protein